MAKKSKKTITASDKARAALEQRMRDFVAVSLSADAAVLPANADVEVRRESQRNVETARRADVFDVLRQGLAPGAYDAVRRLEADMLIRQRMSDAAGTGERVDCTQGFTTDSVLAAGERVDGVAARLPPRDWWLLHDLIMRRGAWRETVAYITGETHAHAQAAAVRAACVNLRDLSQRKMLRVA